LFSQNVGLLAILSSDAAAGPRKFYWIRLESFR